mgnify:FL=1
MTEKISLNKLWRESGKKNSFSDFCKEFNAKNFKNFINNESFIPGENTFASDINTKNKMAATMILSPDQVAAKTSSENVPEMYFSKKEGILWIGLGLATGVVVALLVVKHLK